MKKKSKWQGAPYREIRLGRWFQNRRFRYGNVGGRGGGAERPPHGVKSCFRNTIGCYTHHTPVSFHPALVKILVSTNCSTSQLLECSSFYPVAPVAYQLIILEPCIGQFREFEPHRVHTRINSLGLFPMHILTCGKCESMS